MIATSLRPQLTLLAPGDKQRAWDAPPYCLRVEGAGLEEPFETMLEEPFLIVGRDRGAGLMLPDTRVSRRHAYLHLTADGVYVVYLSRRRGVADDGVSPRGGWLPDPATVDFGPYQVILTRVPSNGHSDAMPAPRCELMSTSADRSDHRRVHIHAPQGARAARRLKRCLTLVGRGKPAHLQLVHPSVSRPHCLLFDGGERIWVVDFQSRLGTHVNGEPVRVACVDASDALELGEVRVEIHAKDGRNGQSSLDVAGVAALLPNDAGEGAKRKAPVGSGASQEGAPGHGAAAVAVPQDDVQPGDAVAATDPSSARHGLERRWQDVQRALEMLKRLDRQEEAQGALLERTGKLAARLERLEAEQGTTADQTQQQVARTQALAERVEQLSGLCTETRDRSQVVHDGIRKLADSLDAVQRTLECQRRAWQEQSELVRGRLAEHDERFSDSTAAAEQVEEAPLARHDGRWTELEEAWERQRRDWQEQSVAMEQQHEVLEEQVRVLHELGDHWKQTGAALRTESEELREAWRQQGAAVAEEKADLLDRSDALAREQKAIAELADHLRRQHDEHFQKWEQQHNARVGEQVRLQQQLNELNERRDGLQQEHGRLKELLDRERAIRADQSHQRDEHEARLSRAVEEHAEHLDQLGRRLAELEGADRPQNGNGHDVAAQIAACTEALRAEFHDAIRRSSHPMTREVHPPQQPRGAEGVEIDHGTQTHAPAGVPARECPGDIPLCDADRDEAAEETARELVEPAVAEPMTADADEEPESTETDELATQWLFQRTVTIRDDQRRRSRRRMMLALCVASATVVTAGGLVLWWLGLIETAGKLMFG